MVKEEKVYMARPMKLVEGFKDEVDIIVPFHGQYEKVTRLIESLYRMTAYVKFNLILVDDGSKNSEYINLYLAKATTIQCLRSDVHIGFVEALKLGFINSKANWIVFMNSDVEIIDSAWLKNLGDCYLRNKEHGVKLISAKNNNPCGTEKMLWQERNEVSEDYILEYGEHLSLECVFFHRELFYRIDGFLKNYFPGWYEDEELAYRMNKFNYKQAVCGSSLVFHHGQATINELWQVNPKMKMLMEDNRQKCIEDIKRLIK